MRQIGLTLTAMLLLGGLSALAQETRSTAGEHIQQRAEELPEMAQEVGESIQQEAQRVGEMAQEIGQEVAESVEARVDDVSGAVPSPEEMSEEAEEVAEETVMSPREEAIQALENLRGHIERTMTRGYRGELISEELIGSEMIRKHMRAWFRVRPRSLRLEFISPDEGQVVVWREGWDHMVVDRPWLPALNIDPSGDRAMANSHRPVTAFGIDLTIDRYLDAARQTAEDADVSVEHVGEETIGRQTLDRWDFHHPPVGGSPVASFSIWLHPETLMPIHFENRRADGSIYERYRYTHFELNPSLSNELFED